MESSLQHELMFPARRRWTREAAGLPEIATTSNGAFKLLILFLLLLYSNLAILFQEIEAFRPVLVVAAAALFILFLERGRSRRMFRFMWPEGALLIAFVGVCFISSFSAFWPGYAFGKTLELAKIVMIYVLIENVVTTPSRMRRVLMTMVIGGLFPAIGTIQHYIFHIVRDGRAAWIGVWGNPNEDAYGLVVLIPIAASLAIKSRWPLRIGLAAIIATYLLAIFFTYSRGGLLGVVAVLGLAGWKQRVPLVRAMMIVGLGALLIFAAMYWNRGQGFQDIKQDTTVNQRIATFKAGLAMFEDHPLFGIGPGCSMFAYPFYVPREAQCGCEQQLVVHNTFIQVLSETGILGFLPLMFLLGFSIVRARQLKASALGVYAVALEVALWGFAVCSLSGGFSYSWWPYIFIALVVAAWHISASDIKTLEA